MSDEKYRVVEKIGAGISKTRATGTLLGCKQFLLKQIDKDYTRIMTIEKNPHYQPSFDEWQDEFIKEMAATFGVPEFMLKPDLSWTDPFKEKTEMKNIDCEAMRELLAGIGVTVEEAIENIDANMKALNSTAAPEPKLRPYQQKMIDDLKKELSGSNVSGEWKFHSWINVLTPPAKIQGYTAEQWQEIIDGGYLCEFSFDIEYGESVFGTLSDCNPASPSKHTKESWQLFRREKFKDHDNDPWDFCRPAQIKGVMRPIFVEPIDKDAFCHFFRESESGTYWIAGVRWKDKDTQSHVSKSNIYLEV